MPPPASKSRNKKVSNQPSPWGNYQIGPASPGPRPSGGSGYKPPPQGYTPEHDAAKKSIGLGVASLFLWCCPIVGAALGIMACMYGYNGMQADNQATKNLGRVGMICGVVGVALSAIVLMLGVVIRVVELTNK